MILAPCLSFTPVAKAYIVRYSESRSVTRGLRRSTPCLKTKSQLESEEVGALIEENDEQGLSVLAADIPWENNKIWSTFSLYMFCLHIPLSFGGLSIVAHILHHRLLDPQTQVFSLVLLQMVELSGTVFLLRNTAKPEFRKSINFLKGCIASPPKPRNWVFGSALGLGCLVAFVFITSLAADLLFASKPVHNSELHKIVLNGDVSRSGCFALYCILAPFLEEIVYRRFLLTSLASSMEWRKALVISSGVFAAAHFSGENLVQLFGIGCVLGACYSWSGNLVSSLVVHSLYNALTLLLMLLS